MKKSETFVRLPACCKSHLTEREQLTGSALTNAEVLIHHIIHSEGCNTNLRTTKMRKREIIWGVSPLEERNLHISGLCNPAEYAAVLFPEGACVVFDAYFVDLLC